MTNTTKELNMTIITDEQITALRNEAGTAGDREQVAVCDSALAGDEEARAECARVIADARAQLVEYELHLISDDHEASGGNPRNARQLGTYDTWTDAEMAGRRYLREHPAAWLQVCEPGGHGQDVTP